MNISEARAETLAFMRSIETEPEHVLHVAALALQLFDGLAPLHEMAEGERFLLEAASLLHDIGWSVAADGTAHHKASARLIREHAWRHLSPPEINLVALIARYHRKALPRPEHEDYAALAPEDGHRVNVLAALLRVADALDRGHCQRVQEVRCQMESERIVLLMAATSPAGPEVAAVNKKGDLARVAFRRDLVVALG